MSLVTNITPTNVYKAAVKAKLQNVNVSLGDNDWATITIWLIDEDGNAIAAHEVEMTIEESNAWGGDDSYVLQLALQKLGIN